MGKWKVWLLIVLGILGTFVAGALLGPNVWNATTTPVVSAALGSATREHAMNDVCRFDPSGHKVSFVTVEPGVQLEVLDWGGTGKTLVFAHRAWRQRARVRSVCIPVQRSLPCHRHHASRFRALKPACTRLRR